MGDPPKNYTGFSPPWVQFLKIAEHPSLNIKEGEGGGAYYALYFSLCICLHYTFASWSGNNTILVCKLHVSTLSPFLKPTLHLYLYVSYPPIQIHIHYTHPYSQPLPQPFYSPISPISSIVPTHIAIPTFIHTYDSWQIGSKHFLTNSSNFSCKSFETQN